MEFNEIVMKRYATKMFDGKTLSKKKVEQLLEIIRYAPSSFNIQPWKIIIIKDKEKKERLLPASWNQPQITSCSHLLVFCADTNIKENIEGLTDLMVKNGADAAKIEPYIQMMRDFEKKMTKEQKLSWSQRQLYIALGNALNGAKSLGFDSCPMEGFNPDEYAKILELPSNLVPSVLCPIGYGSDEPKEKLRFANENIFLKN